MYICEHGRNVRQGRPNNKALTLRDAKFLTVNNPSRFYTISRYHGASLAKYNVALLCDQFHDPRSAWANETHQSNTVLHKLSGTYRRLDLPVIS